MSEQLATPNPDEIKSFQSPEQSLPWRPVAKETLGNGEQVIIDTNYEACSLDEIGIESSADYQASVVARVSDALKDTDDEQQNGIDFAFVKINNPSGAVSYHIVSDYVEEDGTVRKNWIDVDKGDKFTIGRLSDASDNSSLGGEDLTGKRFSSGVSRKHLSLELTDSGLEITDLAKYDTKVEGVKNIEDQESRFKPQAKETGAAVLDVSKVQVDKVSESEELEVIDSVPKTAEEAREANDRRIVNESKAKYGEQLDSLNKRLNELSKGISAEDMLSVRGYMSGVENVRKGWEQGNDRFDYSSIGEEAKQKYYEQMSPAAQEVADAWANTYLEYERIQKLMNG